MANPLIAYIKESRAELTKVTWPTRSHVVKDTLVVIGISLSTAVFFGVIDYALVIIFRRVLNI
ncbi:MAG: preprotein translocase subunit SecE [Patescibacteria group bacterium]|jgi:preprotein translocase subunit SecE